MGRVAKIDASMKTLLQGSAFLIIATLLAGVLLALPWQHVLLFIVVQIFVVLLPGAALINLLFRRKLDPLAFLFLSYATGYVLTMVEYLLCAPLGFEGHVQRYLAIAVGVAALIIVILRRSSFMVEPWDRKQGWPYLLMFIIFCIVAFLSYAACSTLPGYLGDSTGFSVDLNYWIGNAAALTQNFLPENIRVAGFEYHYHYFSSMQLAYLYLVSGIPVLELAVPLFSTVKSLLLFGCMYLLATLVDTKRCYKVVFIFALLFATGFEDYTTIINSNTLFLQPFGADAGQAMQALTLFFLVSQIQEKNIKPGVLVLFCIAWMAAVGTKAPFAAVSIFAIAVVCFYWLFKKEFAKALLYGILTLGVFFLVCGYCIDLFGENSDVSSAWTIFGTAAGCSGLAVSFVGWMLNLGIPNIVAKLIALLVYEVALNPVMFLFFILGLVSLIARKAARTNLNVALFVASTVGLMLGEFSLQDGWSQGYFTGGTFVFTAFLALNLSSMLPVFSKKLFRGLVLALLVLQSVLLLFFTFGSTVSPSGVFYSAKRGAINIAAHFEGEEIHNPADPYSVTEADEEALSWIRDNTEVGCLVVSDRSALTSITYMFYGMISQRTQYLEGYCYDRGKAELSSYRKSLLENMYANDPEALQEVLGAGADYLVQTKAITPDFAPNPDVARLVYESDSIAVYQVVAK